MSYTKREWATGNVVGAVDLNRMEDGIAEANGKSGCDGGFECETTYTTLFDQSVTTTAIEDTNFSSATLTFADNNYYLDDYKLRVTFDSTEYICEKGIDNNYCIYGAPFDYDLLDYDWSEYPFSIKSRPATGPSEPTPLTELYIGTAGSHTLKIEKIEESVTVDSCFDNAVKWNSTFWITATPYEYDGNIGYEANKTYEEAKYAYDHGAMVFLKTLEDENLGIDFSRVIPLAWISSGSKIMQFYRTEIEDNYSYVTVINYGLNLTSHQGKNLQDATYTYNVALSS